MRFAHVTITTAMILTFGLAACKKKDSDGKPGAVAKDVKKDPPPGMSGQSADKCTDRAKLAAEAIKDGQKVLAGITLNETHSQTDLLAKRADWEGKKVRIDGPIVGICKKMGCWAALRGPKGKTLNLKVVDGEIDFRTLAKKGLYAVGEGVFMARGPHGAQVKITGAMIGKTSCL